MEGFGWYTYEITKRLVENGSNLKFLSTINASPSMLFLRSVTPTAIYTLGAGVILNISHSLLLIPLKEQRVKALKT